MNKGLVVSAAAAAAVAGALLIGTGISANPVLTPEQTLDRRAIGELEFSPDGSKLAFTVTDPVKGKARARAIWLLDLNDLNGGRLRQLTFSGASDGSPRWAPDGSAIAFTSDRDGGEAQLYLLSLRGGEAERLYGGKEKVESFRWSPDGARIALLMKEPKPDTRVARERDRDDGRVADKDDLRARIWMLDMASRRLAQVTAGRWKVDQIEWLPDGRELVAVATDHPETDQWIHRIYRVNVRGVLGSVPQAVADVEFVQVAAPRGPFGSLSVSPDGRTIAYIGARTDGPEPHDLYLQPIAGGAPENLTGASLDRPIGQPRWIDERSLTVHVQRGFASTLATIGRDGQTTLLDDLDVNPTAYARAGGVNAGTLAYVGETVTRAPELYIKTPGARPRAATTLNKAWASVPLAVPAFIKYKSADGVDIEAELLKPVASKQPPAASNQPPTAINQPQGPWPFVVLVHGGPTGRWADAFEPWGQLLAARGYAVLYPNVRGSTGYGHAFVEMNRGDWGGGDFKDVIAGVDAMVAQGIADPSRLGIGGWSYGGYMAAWAVTQTARFRAAVSGAPVIDMASEFGTEDGSAYDEWFYGTPYERLDGFIKSSPITHVKNVKTPTLLLQGEDDLTDPVGQSQQFYRGLKRYHVDTDLVLYPREPHGLREEKHLLDRMNRIVGWFDKYLMKGN
jgi:dipeptidyl aminopeptidase/acylaminoacyl peptidase